MSHVGDFSQTCSSSIFPPLSKAAVIKPSCCCDAPDGESVCCALAEVTKFPTCKETSAEDKCCDGGSQKAASLGCEDGCCDSDQCDDTDKGCCGGNECQESDPGCDERPGCCDAGPPDVVKSGCGNEEGCCDGGKCETADSSPEEKCGCCDVKPHEALDLGCQSDEEGCCGGGQREMVGSSSEEEKCGCCDVVDLGCESDEGGCCGGGQHKVVDLSPGEEKCGCCEEQRETSDLGCESNETGCCSGGRCEAVDLGCEDEGACCEVGKNVTSKGKNDTNSKGCYSGGETETGSGDIDDDSVCKCCLTTLINEPQSFLPSSQGIVDDFANATITYLEAQLGVLRACCKAFEHLCARRACCFIQPVASTIPISTAPLPAQLTGPPRRTSPRSAIAKTPGGADFGKDMEGSETLRLEIRGMDCASCMPKVGRALAQLPSVTPVNLDYFGGTAELRYNPETIASPAIIAYVARATGFEIKALSGDTGDGGATIVTLPLLFPTKPPLTVFDGFDIRIGPNPLLIEVSFPVHTDSPHQPREVLQRFKPFGAELAASGHNGNRDMATRDLISVSIRTIACAICSIPVLVLAWADLPHRPTLYGAISVGFTTLIQVLAFPIVSSACRSILFLRQADMSVLVAISTLTAYIFSVMSYAFEVAGRPFVSPFFETSALLVTLIFLGRTISAATRRSTGSVLHELQRLQPTEVLLLSDKETPPQRIDSRLLHHGDIIRITPETRVATDGVVVAGSSDADESSVTGESVAVSKQPGSRLIAGTLNLGGTLDVQVTQLTHENSLSRITALVKRAQSSRSPIQDLSDRLAAIVLPVAAVSACLAFLAWVFVGLYARHQPATPSSVNALTYAIAILVISCPCAIGLAVPVVISVAIRIGIHEGVLFRSADVLESAHHIDVVAFDKTGTLTQGNFTTERAEILFEGAEWIVHALVKDNKHPVSQGVYRHLNTHLSAKAQLSDGALTDIVSLPGKGIKALLSGYPVLGGNIDFTGACDHPLSSELRLSGLTVFTVTLAGQPIAFFGLADTPRLGADALVAELTRRGKDVIILSGDTPSAVRHLANAIGVPIASTHPACSPEDKDATIAALQASGKRVCFVGDGTNDGPALSRADIALAIGGSSDVALTAAGAVLLGSDLHRGVLALLDVAEAARMHARLALLWCLLYNVFAILLASGALVKVRIEPRWAGIGEVVSILPVFVIGFGLDVRWRWRRRR